MFKGIRLIGAGAAALLVSAACSEPTKPNTPVAQSLRSATELTEQTSAMSTVCAMYQRSFETQVSVREETEARMSVIEVAEAKADEESLQEVMKDVCN